MHPIYGKIRVLVPVHKLCSATKMMRSLDRLYESQNMGPGDIVSTKGKDVNVLRLCAIIDHVIEQLPTLLELGGMLARQIGNNFNFLYHQPSVLSLATVESVLLPESLRFALLQVFVNIGCMLRCVHLSLKL